MGWMKARNLTPNHEVRSTRSGGNVMWFRVRETLTAGALTSIVFDDGTGTPVTPDTEVFARRAKETRHDDRT